MVKKLSIAVSARALFKMDEENDIFLKSGVDEYIRYQIENENVPLEPGSAFPLIQKLLCNEFRINNEDEPPFEVIVCSNIHADASLRVIKSIDHYELPISKSAFIGKSKLIPYLKAFGTDLLLTRSEEDTQLAVDSGIPAAMLYAEPTEDNVLLQQDEKIRISFDGDAVLFSDESEFIYKTKGLEAFLKNEKTKAHDPLTEGPLAKFMKTIQSIQNQFPDEAKPFSVSLVTARGGDARERVIQTLRTWQVTMDEMFFLSGMKKAPILEALNPHIFFDDQDYHLRHSSKIVPSAKVPYVTGSELSNASNLA